MAKKSPPASLFVNTIFNDVTIDIVDYRRFFPTQRKDYCTTNSTRRFLARPESAWLVARGEKLATPLAFNCAAS
jgi:hypothetical protein